jgi:Rhodopirellula transposase DDE domain
VPALLALVEPGMRGDRVSRLRWAATSARVLAAELAGRGHRVSAVTVAGLVHEEGFGLRAGVRTVAGKQRPGRDAQFGCLGEQVRARLASGDLVVGVGTENK